MTGQQIKDLADGLEPLTPRDLGPVVQGFALFFGVVSVIVVCLRIYVRAGYSGVAPRLLGLEDYMTVVATVSLPSLQYMICFWSTDGLIHSQTDATDTRRYFRRSRCTIWSWMSRCQPALTIIPRTRIRVPDVLGDSILYLIDRYQVRHRIHLHTTGQPTASGLSHISQHGSYGHRDCPGPYVCLCKLQADCRNMESGTVSLLPPSSLLWRRVMTVLIWAIRGTCQKKISLQTVSYIVSAIQMATDWVCAAIPCFIVAGLQMSRRRKISVIAILGLGVSASVATCVRMPYLKYYDTVKYPEEIACKPTPLKLGPINAFADAEISIVK
jgi:hypothetical protein